MWKLSPNNLIAGLLPYFPKKLVWIVSKKYIAGPELGDAVNVIKELNSNQVLATVDVLGESVTNQSQAAAYQKLYLDTLQAVIENKLNTTLSLKPTMFGLKTDYEHCYKLIHEIVAEASKHGFFVRIDMEDSSCTDTELRLFKSLYQLYPAHVGIVLQAYLRRTANDINEIAAYSQPENPVNIRLCKGIYRESRKIAFHDKGEINANFLTCLELMLKKGLFPAIATHDQKLVEESMNLLNSQNKEKKDYEFQMLYGVTPRLRQRIVADGHAMRVYVPYGQEWFYYSTRRLKENPAMVWDIIQGIFLRK